MNHTPIGPIDGGKRIGPKETQKTPPPPSAESVLKKEIFALLDSPYTDFIEISDKIWRSFSEKIPDFEEQAAQFISGHWDKFSQIRSGETWEGLKERLSEQMAQSQTREGKPVISWERFRDEFVEITTNLGNQALLEMKIPKVKIRALGTTGWRSDIDLEICPEEGSNMSEKELMTAQIVFETIASHLLGIETTELRGREPGSVLDLQFYTEHYAKQHSIFDSLTSTESQSEFYLQELSMGVLQHIRAYGNDLRGYFSWKEKLLQHLENAAPLKAAFMQIFDEVEKFETLVEKEILQQMLFEVQIIAFNTMDPEKPHPSPENIRSDIENLSMEELKDKVSILTDRPKASERYKLAACTIKAKRLLHLCESIDLDKQQAQKLQLKISQLKKQRAPIRQIEKTQISYEHKLLDASIKLALRTTFFEEAVYTRAEYNSTVMGPEGQFFRQQEEKALQRRLSGAKTGQHIVKRKTSPLTRQRALSNAEKAASVLELRALSAHQQNRQRSESVIVSSSKYDDRLAKQAIHTMQDKTRFLAGELEKCKRKKILSQTAFEHLLQEALEKEGLKNAPQIAQKARKLFDKGEPLFDEGTDTKLSPEEKYRTLIAFLNSQGVATDTSKDLTLHAQDPELEQILRCKVGNPEYQKPEIKNLFERGEKITLEKLGLDSEDAISRYYSALDRETFQMLRNAFENINFSAVRQDRPRLEEIWQSTKIPQPEA